jgi:predicted DsbA family dithiol-disulfide isomerase
MSLRKTTAILLMTAAVAAPAFAKKDKAKAEAPAATTSAAPASGDSGTAATVGGAVITMDELDKAAANQLAKVHQQEFQVRSDALTGMIQQKLLANEAAARKVTEADLLQTEVDAKTPAPTQDEVSQYYEKMKSHMGGKTLDDVKGDIEKVLKAQKSNERRAQFLTELSAKNEVKIMLEPPRSNIALRPTAPIMGPADAPITIVEWSDYQCPFCKRAHPTVEQVLTEYKGKVRFIYLDYPLPFHPMAMPAAQAVHCAQDQGKFWEYHKNLFEAPGDLSKADLSKRATDIGLDAAAFEACTTSNKFDSLIKTNYDDGQALGVTGTPAFFINGRMLVGAQPIEQFRDIINDELSRKGVAVAKAGSGTN